MVNLGSQNNRSWVCYQSARADMLFALAAAAFAVNEAGRLEQGGRARHDVVINSFIALSVSATVMNARGSRGSIRYTMATH